MSEAEIDALLAEIEENRGQNWREDVLADEIYRLRAVIAGIVSDNGEPPTGSGAD